jgi:hypothetical protein
MKKNDIFKIAVTSIASIFITIVILSFTVIGSKANKDYVDEQDKEIRTEIKTTMSEHEKIHEETNRQFTQIQTDLTIIKEYLINKP